MKKIGVFVCLLGILVLASCSDDDKDCKKVKSASGTKENGVMVYRVTLDNGERLVVNKATAEYYTNSNATKECYSLK